MVMTETATAVLEDTTEPAFAAAFTANMVDFYTTLGRAPGGEVGVESDIAWFISGLPVPVANGVVRTYLSPTLDSVAVRERLAGVLARFQRRGVPLLWWLPPGSQPDDIGSHLTALGMRPAGAVPGMALRLAELRDSPLPVGVTIEEIVDEAGLAVLARTFTDGYELPQATEAVVQVGYRSRGLGADQPLRHFLALLDGSPVATASLLLSGGVASLNAVATVPAARGRGIGAAISAAPMRVAHALGYQVGILQASDMGAPVYRRLGFRDCFPLPVHVWSP